MPSIETILSANGLQTSPNNLGAGQVGALVEASNVMIRFKDVIEPRRGQQYYSVLQQPNSSSINQMMFFEDEVVVHASDNRLHYHKPAQAYLEPLGAAGTVVPAADTQRLKFANAADNLYVCTDKAVRVLESLTSRVLRPSGIPIPYDLTYTLVSQGADFDFLATAKSVAYRVVFGYRDGNERVYIGPPSFPLIVTNTSGSDRAVSLEITTANLPRNTAGTELLPGLFFQLFRSKVVDSTETPGDELFQITERFFQPDEISSTVYVDITPESSQSGVPLYTNATEEGIIQSNNPAPYCTDIANWDQRVWYANTEQPQQLTLQILGIGAGAAGHSGVQVGDVLRIQNADASEVLELTGTASLTPSPYQFTVYTSGTVAQNILDTTKSLVKQISKAAKQTDFPVRAFLLQSDTYPTGAILLQNKDDVKGDRQQFNVSLSPAPLDYTRVGVSGLYFGAAPHTVTHGYQIGDTIYLTDGLGQTEARTVTNVYVSGAADINLSSAFGIAGSTGTAPRAYAATAWSPQLPIYPSDQALDVVSDNDASSRRIYYSKVDLPEAVPLLNYIDVGTEGRAILRIYPNRNRLLVFKEEATYIVYGDYGNYSVQLLDDTVQLLAPDSVASVGSTVFALVDDGVVAINESSLAPISEIINAQLMPYLGTTGRAFTATAFGVAHESDQLYSLWLPYVPTFAQPRAFVYGLRGNAWTNWELARTCGRVNPFSDTLYMGQIQVVQAEAHDSNRSDYVDKPTSSTTESYTCRVTYASTVLNNASLTKQARELHVHFRRASFQTGDFFLTTDISTAESPKIPVAPGSVYVSGVAGNWIGPPVAPSQFRKLIPQEYQRAAYYNISFQTNEKYAYWALNGISTVFENTSERTGTVR
jgi:hypothetical protein